MPSKTPTPAPPRRWTNVEFVENVTVTAPAVRVAAITVSAQESGGETHTWPHVYHAAIVERTTLREASNVLPAGDDRRPATVEDARGLGWDVGELHARHDLIVVDDEFGLTSFGEIGDAVNVAHQVAQLPWPAVEDDARLAPLIARLTAEAVEKLRPYERDRAAAPAVRPEAALPPLSRRA